MKFQLLCGIAGLLLLGGCQLAEDKGALGPDCRGDEDCTSSLDTGPKDAGTVRGGRLLDVTGPCPRSTNALLQEIGEDISSALDCGNYNFLDDSSEGMTCLQTAIAEGATASLTVNHCIDCLRETTYVITASQAHLAISISDPTDEQLREARIDECESLNTSTKGSPQEPAWPQCAGAEAVYRCTEPSTSPRATWAGEQYNP